MMARASRDHLMSAGPAEVDRDNTPEYQGHGWQHISNLHTCQHCDRIIITHRQLKRGLVSLPHTKLEAIQAEADGCPFFDMLMGWWRLHDCDGGPGALLSALLSALLKLFRFLFYMDNFGVCDSLVGTPAMFTKMSAENQARSKKIAVLLRKTQFILDNLRRRRFYLFVSSQRLELLYGTTALKYFGIQLKILEGSEGTIDTGGDLSLKVFNTKYDTEKTYANIKTLVSGCTSSHGACRISPVGFVPSRLLKVSPHSGPDHIRLVETRSDRAWTWACLSYVWGGHQRHKTTRNVLPEYLKDICIEVLPQTIKDAVSVCRELGIPYLWIDSFCIVQDDELDKTREIPQMSLIYRHALLTIAATRAHSVEEGFLHQLQPLCCHICVPTSLRFIDRRGRESKPFVLTQRRPPGMIHESDEPLDSRAWALQEQLLSPRWLSYSSHGPVWSCRCLLQEVKGQPDPVSRPRYIGEHPGINHNNDIVPCISGQKMLPWENIVQLYSPRQATLPSDKLVALSAVAQTYSENSKQHDTYLAGIWRNSMPLSLLWYVSAEDQRPRPSEYTAPSWSWASVGGAVQYEDRTWRIDRDCELIDAQIRTVNSNVFGAVLGGELIVDAKIRECRVRYDKSRTNQSTMPHANAYFWVSGGPKIKFEADTTEFWTSLCKGETDVTLLIVTHDGLLGRSGLVLARNTNSESFTRVSYFQVWFIGDRMVSRCEYDEFFEGFKIKRVTIV